MGISELRAMALCRGYRTSVLRSMLRGCCAALVLFVVCGASQELLPLDDSPMEPIGLGDPQQIASMVSKPKPTEVESDGVSEIKATALKTVAAAAEQAREKADEALAKPAAKETTPAVANKLPEEPSTVLANIKSYVSERMASPDVVALREFELNRFKKKYPGALDLAVKNTEPATAEEAARGKIEAAILKSMKSAANKAKMMAAEKAAVANEVKKIDNKVHLKQIVSENVTVSAQSALKKDEVVIQKEEAQEKSKVATLSEAAKVVGAAGQPKIQARIAIAKEEVAADEAQAAKAKELGANLQAEVRKDVKKDLKANDKLMKAAVSKDVKKDVEEKVEQKAQDAAEKAIKDVVSSMKKGMGRAVARKKRDGEIKLAKARLMARNADPTDSDEYWSRRRRYAERKADMLEKIDDSKKGKFIEERIKANARKKQKAEQKIALEKSKAKELEDERAAEKKAKVDKELATKAGLKAQIKDQLSSAFVNAIATQSVVETEDKEKDSEEKKESAAKEEKEEEPETSVQKEARLKEEYELFNSKLGEQKVLAEAEKLRVTKAKARINRRNDAVQDAVMMKQAKDATVLLTNAQVEFKKHKANLELSLDNIDQTKMKGKAIKVELDEVVKYNSDPNTVAFDSIMKKVGSADFLNMAKAAVKETLNPKPKVADAPAMVRQLSTQEKVEQAEAAVEVDDHNLEQKKDQVKKVQQEKLVADEKERIQAARAKAANRAKIAALAAELKHDQLNAPPGVAIADATGKEAKSEAKEEKSEEKPAAKEDAKEQKVAAKEDAKEQKPAAKEDAKEQKPAAKEQKVAAKEQKPAAKEQKPAAKEQKPTQEKPAANKKPTDEEKPKLRE